MATTYRRHERYTLDLRALAAVPAHLKSEADGTSRTLTIGEIWTGVREHGWTLETLPDLGPPVFIVDGAPTSIDVPHWARRYLTLTSNELHGSWYYEARQLDTMEPQTRYRFLLAGSDPVSTFVVYDDTPAGIIVTPSPDARPIWYPDPGYETEPFDVYRRFYETKEGRSARRFATLQMLEAAGLSGEGFLDQHDDSMSTLLATVALGRRELVSEIRRATWIVTLALVMVAAAIYFR